MSAAPWAWFGIGPTEIAVVLLVVAIVAPLAAVALIGSRVAFERRGALQRALRSRPRRTYE